MNKKEIINKFKFIEPDRRNIDEIFSTNRRVWYYNNSDSKKIKNGLQLEIEKGVLKSELEYSNTKEGFQLSIEEFIDSELKEMEAINKNELTYKEAKLYEFYFQYLEWKKKNRNYTFKNDIGFALEEHYNLKEYSKAIWSYYFRDILNQKNDNENKSDNLLYYVTTLNSWLEQVNKYLDDNSSLKHRVNLLKTYNRILSNLASETVEFFEIVFTYKPDNEMMINEFNMRKFNILLSLESLNRHSIVVNHNISTGYYRTAMHIQHYCLLMFESILSLLDDRFYIKIGNSPLYENFEMTRSLLKNSIDIEKLKLMMNINDEVQIKDSNDKINFDVNIEFPKLKPQTSESIRLII